MLVLRHQQETKIWIVMSSAARRSGHNPSRYATGRGRVSRLFVTRVSYIIIS
ncbi:hypothetical protein Hanom_Chr01g00040961 [Helianthus anomalus]